MEKLKLREFNKLAQDHIANKLWKLDFLSPELTYLNSFSKTLLGSETVVATLPGERRETPITEGELYLLFSSNFSFKYPFDFV